MSMTPEGVVGSSLHVLNPVSLFENAIAAMTCSECHAAVNSRIMEVMTEWRTVKVRSLACMRCSAPNEILYEAESDAGTGAGRWKGESKSGIGLSVSWCG